MIHAEELRCEEETGLDTLDTHNSQRWMVVVSFFKLVSMLTH
jgi:hypothetical protein